jgi:hypothetical protein
VDAARALAARRWAKCDDRSAATAPGRAAFESRFTRQVDPDGTLNPTVRAELADQARADYFRQLGQRSGQARRAKSGQADVA